MSDTLDTLHAEVLACENCPLHTTRTQAVPGAGHPSAQIMFIGEGPGANEDKEGIPFCGAAGKFLDEMLASVGIDRSDVYITNVVKCRPPDNRDPLPEEATACRPYLERQIKLIQPKIIALLGRHAMAHFLPPTDFKISQCHGQVYRQKNGQIIIPLYHPAAALYNGSMRQTLLADFQTIIKTLRQIDAPSSDK